MYFHIIAIGDKTPPWVRDGVAEYQKRFPPPFRLTVQEVPALKRTRNRSVEEIRLQESARLWAAVPRGYRRVVLDIEGMPWNSEALAARLGQWRGSTGGVALLIGGPDGVDKTLLQRADERWSLSPLTFPHALVRLLVAEQIYRAVTMIRGHPYHR